MWIADNCICDRGWDHIGKKYQVRKGERAKNLILTFCGLVEYEHANRVERRGKEIGGKWGDNSLEAKWKKVSTILMFMRNQAIIGLDYCFISKTNKWYLLTSNCN